MDIWSSSEWRKNGWWFSIRREGKTENILILKDKLKEAARELKQMNPTYRVIFIERHEVI